MAITDLGRTDLRSVRETNVKATLGFATPLLLVTRISVTHNGHLAGITLVFTGQVGQCRNIGLNPFCRFIEPLDSTPSETVHFTRQTRTAIVEPDSSCTTTSRLP